MKIRTFFWHNRVISKFRFFLKRVYKKETHRFFLFGNAGDIITQDIIKYKYGLKALNINRDGNRLLCVGSISHKINKGDILCGIGTKGLPIPDASSSPCEIIGLRGPITYDYFKKAGYDLRSIRFLKDPGLMIRFLINKNNILPAGNKIIFIPHYRERNMYHKLPKGIRLVNIDSKPVDLAYEIQSSRLVYSSSLHGIIFAHALNRPCVMVKPQTDEPLIKYEDYFASMDLTFKKPLDNINNVNFKQSPDSPPDLKYSEEDFLFPSIQHLIDHGIAQ